MILFQGRFLESSGGISRDSNMFLKYFTQYSSQKELVVSTRHRTLFVKPTEYVFKSQIDPYLLAGTRGQVLQRVHDIFPMTNPEWFTVKSRISFHIGLFLLKKKAVKFICNSEATRMSLIRNKIATEENTFVVHCADSLLDSKDCGICDACHYVRKKPYCLTVGTIEPRKNYRYIIDQWPSSHEIPYLVVVGRYGWKARKEVQGLRSTKNIIWLKKVCDSQLIRLYQDAALYFSASLNEGFNIPVTEALNRRTLVLISDIPVHRELYAGRAKFFNWNESLLNQLLQILPKENLSVEHPMYTEGQSFEEMDGLSV